MSKRDLRGILTQCVMPVLSLLFGLSALGSYDGLSASPPVLDIDAAAYQSPLILPTNEVPDGHSVIAALSGSDDVAVQWNESLRRQSLRGMNEWMVDEHHGDALYGGLYVDEAEDAVTLLFDAKATHC